MPAENVTELLAFEDAINTALAARLTAAGLEPFRPREQDDLPDYFALPSFIKGAGGHLFRTPVGGLEFDLFNDCAIEIQLVAPRVPNATETLISGVYTKLAEMAVRARWALRVDALGLLNAELAYHHCTRLIPSGDEIGFDDERALDRHVLRYRCAAGIKPDAWPTEESAYALPT